MPKKKPIAKRASPEKTSPAKVKKSKTLASRYKSFRLRKRAARPEKKLSGSFRLFADSLRLIRQYWKLFGGIVVVYSILTLVLVGGMASIDIKEGKELLKEIGTGTQLSTSLTLFGLLLGSVGGTPSESGAVYQSIIVLIVSLAVIWALRQAMSGEKASVRDAFYKGMYPLIPFVLTLFVIGLQLTPLLAGSFINSLAIKAGFTGTVFAQVILGVLVFLLALLSLYLICSSIFALYIVTLPDVRPVQALRSARDLVRHRRWTIMRKLLFLPLTFLVIGAAITIPLIILLPTAAQWVFVILSMISLVVMHTYIYNLYRELL